MASKTKPHRERFEVPHYDPFSHHLVSPWASWLNIKKSPVKSPENNLYPSLYSLPQKPTMRDLPHICRESKNKRYKTKSFWVWTFYPALMVERRRRSTFQWYHVITFLDGVKEKLSEKNKGKNSRQGSRDRNEHPAGADVTNLGGETVPLWCHMGPILQIFVLEHVLWQVEQVLPSLAFLRRSVTNKRGVWRLENSC